MKFLLLYFALALPIGYIFGVDEYERVSTMAAISKDPVFSPAKFEELVVTQSKRDQRFRVRFSYVVNGKTFQVITTPTDKDGAMSYISNTAQVVHSASNPSIGTLKRYYDLRQPGETMVRALFVVALLALLLALPIALAAAWRLGWLRRKGK